MIENRDAWMDLLFSDDIEGGWSDRPKNEDPGGKTMHGISIGCFSDYLGREATAEELKQITPDKCRDIAITMFWNPVGADFLPGGVDVLAADFAFHSHWTRAAKELQELVGLTGKDVDGFVGPNTVTAVRKQKPRDLVMRYADARMEFLEALPNWEPNARGWAKRVRLMRELALKKVQANPTVADAVKSAAVATASTGATAGGLGIWYYFDQLAPVWEAAKHMLDPQAIEKLKAVDAGVKGTAADQPWVALAILGYMTVTSLLAIYQRVQLFRKGRVVS